MHWRQYVYSQSSNAITCVKQALVFAISKTLARKVEILSRRSVVGKPLSLLVLFYGRCILGGEI